MTAYLTIKLSTKKFIYNLCLDIYQTFLKKSKQRKHRPKTAPDGATNVVFSGVMDSFGVIFFDI